MRTTFRLGIAVTFLALSLNAQTNELGVWAAASQVGDTNVEGSEIAFDAGKGFGVSFNHFWTRSLSTEFSATALSHDGRITITGEPALDIGSLDLIPVTATVQWHFARGSLLSPYIGGGVSYVMADDLRSADLQQIEVDRVEIDSKVGWVAQAGLDIGLTTRFAIAADAKYIAYSPQSAAPGDPAPVDLELDPLIFSLGVKLRW